MVRYNYFYLKTLEGKTSFHISTLIRTFKLTPTLCWLIHLDCQRSLKLVDFCWKVGRIWPPQFITFLFNFLFLLGRKKRKIWLGRDSNPRSINLKPIALTIRNNTKIWDYEEQKKQNMVRPWLEPTINQSKGNSLNHWNTKLLED